MMVVLRIERASKKSGDEDLLYCMQFFRELDIISGSLPSFYNDLIYLTSEILHLNALGVIRNRRKFFLRNNPKR